MNLNRRIPEILWSDCHWSTDLGRTSSGHDCWYRVYMNTVDRAGNMSAGVGGGNLESLSFTVDQAPPSVTITNPMPTVADMRWSNPDEPSISGTAADLSEITAVWLTIKDEGSKRWWDGASWVASKKWFNGSVWVVDTDIKVSASKSGTTNVSWEYTCLAREIMRSGIFTITAYARDKFGHVGHAVVSGKNKKKSELGEKKYTEYSIVLPNFTVSYGQTKNLCAIVTPSKMTSILSSKLTYEINPAGVFEITTGPGCDGISLAVKSSINTCLKEGSVALKIDDETVASAVGTIIIPTSETMVNLNQPIRDCSTVFPVSFGTQFDFVDQWLVTETAASSGLNLTGVPFREDLRILSNNCTGVIGQKLPVGATSSNSDILPGNGVSQPNQWIDLIGFCGAAVVNAGENPPHNCSFSRRQAITIGSCPFKSYKQTISFDFIGSVSTSRVPQ